MGKYLPEYLVGNDQCFLLECHDLFTSTWLSSYLGQTIE